MAIVTNSTKSTKQIAQKYARMLLAIFEHNQLTGAKITSAQRGARHLALGARLRQPKELDKALALSEQVALSTNVNSVLSFRNEGELIYQFGLREIYWKSYNRSNTPDQAIGIAESETPVIFQFDDSRPHTAIAGATGSGKTVALKSTLYSIAATATPDDTKIVLLDCFGAFGEFDNLAHLAMPIAVQPKEIETGIKFVEQELKSRIANSDRTRNRLVLLADETETIFNDAKQIERLKAMAKTGRQFKVNLLLGSQQFKETDLPGVVSELNNRYIGMVGNASISARLTGQSGLQAHKLLGKGDFLKVEGSKTTRFQVAMVTQSDAEKLPRADIQPVVIEDDIQPEIIMNFANEIKEDRGGRPATCVTPELAASYFYQFPKKPSFRQAAAAGITRTQHEQALQFTVDFIKAYIELSNEGIRGYLK